MKMKKVFLISVLLTLLLLFASCASKDNIDTKHSTSASPSASAETTVSLSPEISTPPQTTQSVEPAGQPSSSSSAIASSGVEGGITEADAISIALNHANLSQNDVRRLKTEQSRENGIPVYDVEFVNNLITYEYAIEIATGEIISFDRDISKRAIDTGTRITESEAIAIVLNEIPGASEDDVQSIRLDDDDDGWAVFEGNINFNGFNFEFDVSAINGMILSWDRRAI